VEEFDPETAIGGDDNSRCTRPPRLEEQKMAMLPTDGGLVIGNFAYFLFFCSEEMAKKVL
jgi:hypothetical protein